MRVIIILAAIALSHGAKLERTYLPPSTAGTAGGSGSFLQTPLSGQSGATRGPSARNYQGTPSFGNDFAQSGNDFAQPGTDFAQSGNDFDRSGKGFTQPGNNYAQPQNGFVQTGAEYNNVNFNFAQESRPERHRAALERNAAILRQDSSNDGETFSYAFETENGIYAEESGVATNGVEAQGGYSYTGDDGRVYSVRYTADQNGFVPQGDHLPTPPPVPEEILRALEQNARDEAAGIYDDGSYNEGKYSDDGNTNQFYQNNAYNGNSDDTIITNSAFARSGNARAYNAPSNAYGAPNAQNNAYSAPNAPSNAYGVPNANIDVSSTYGTPEARAFNAPNAVAPTYGAPEARANNASPNAVAPVYGAPNARVFGSNRNAATFNAAANAPNAPSSGVARSLATEKAYLPPLANQRGQARNASSRRQQSFDARTGYNY